MPSSVSVTAMKSRKDIIAETEEEDGDGVDPFGTGRSWCLVPVIMGMAGVMMPSDAIVDIGNGNADDNSERKQ